MRFPKYVVFPSFNLIIQKILLVVSGMCLSSSNPHSMDGLQEQYRYIKIVAMKNHRSRIRMSYLLHATSH